MQAGKILRSQATRLSNTSYLGRARSQRHNVKACVFTFSAMHTHNISHYRPQGPFGIKSNWKKTPNTRPMQSPGAFHGARTSTREAESDIEPNPTPPRGETTEPDDTPVYGFVSENSGTGRFENNGEKKSSESLKYKV